MFLRPDISQVFTPRRTEVNECVYVHRPEHERELKNALKGTLHVFLRGDSGNGKSWLYRSVILNSGYYLVEANCANAARLNSVTNEIYETSIPYSQASLESFDEAKSAELNAAIAKGSLNNTRKYSVKRDEALLSAFSHIRKSAGEKAVVLALDNLEAIFSSQKLMEELGNILILLDDPRYSKFKIKILLIGTPRSISDYYSQIPNFQTIGNRVHELSELSPLTKAQVDSLTSKGFIELLKADIDREVFRVWQEHIYKVTLGIPQRVHEYCEQLAYILEDNLWTDKLIQLEEADIAWLKIGIKESCHVIDGLMNNNSAKTGRRNQVLYALSKINKSSFTSKDVEDLIRDNFYQSTEGVSLQTGKILAELTKGDRSILRRTRKANQFTFQDPRYVMALRVMLNKRQYDEKVTKIIF